MNRDIISSAHARLGVIGAFLIVSASAALGTYYGFTVGAHSHVALGVIFGGAALGGEILKPFAVAAAFEAFRTREWTHGLACAGLAFVLVAYSLTAELSLAAGSRGDLANARQSAADVLQTERERRSRALAELDRLPPARTAAELGPQTAKLKATLGRSNCSRPRADKGTETLCGQIAALQSESGRSERRLQLERIISEADAALATAASGPAIVKDADPLASTISAYLGAFGRDVRPAALSPWLALIPVLFLEFGSAFAFVVGRTRAVGAPREMPAGGTLPVSLPATPPTPSAPEAPAGDDEPPRPPPAPDKGRRSRRSAGGKRRPLRSNVVELVKARGGKLEGCQREIARALGASVSRTNELLHELAAAGRLRLETGRSGTVVHLR